MYGLAMKLSKVVTTCCTTFATSTTAQALLYITSNYVGLFSILAPIPAYKPSIMHPKARVVGTNLSPIQPFFVPPKLELVIDGVEFQCSFRPDCFNCPLATTNLASAIADLSNLLKQAYLHMKSSGWIELSKFTTP
ncbi:hypothetical protein ASPZODRAFT_1878670 [Penicilliopsis zonata CBS 506.65]|uniref:Uncharacterized protein n=1 Tax=Penicilliopsis zonata CBS 506.65 TaxID=1073090 RepID=A0A1L9SIJ3_9EURO|nr:hypothetical protein ASPZODRAFT_1878670 [Penicilliopsis zonata CBS 506.65]OJJ47035.1 hypothetical protein ASPZODRAFT_1878670 [Penicilliopsis zonata CBS 506.65]